MGRASLKLVSGWLDGVGEQMCEWVDGWGGPGGVATNMVVDGCVSRWMGGVALVGVSETRCDTKCQIPKT